MLRKSIRIFPLLAAFVIGFKSNTHAQLFPVQASVQLLPPYSVYLSDYATPGSEKLRVILVQGDFTQPEYQLRLVMSIELDGRVIMRTSRSFNPAPITVSPGIPTAISGAELAPYLDSKNIDFVGYSREQYERTRALPEGGYRIIFTAFDYRRQDVQVSNQAGSFYYLAKNEPPLVNFPACGTRIALVNPQQIIFSWLPRNTASPTSAADTQYEFSLYEMRPANRNPNDVVLTTPAVYQYTTDVTQLVYGPAEPMLIENMQYVWRVRAIDRNGRDAFRNNGYSEVCTFTYTGVDPNALLAVSGVQATGETERRGKVWWTAEGYDSYRVFYKKRGIGFEWFKQDTDQGEIKLLNLEPSLEYETRVQGKKGGAFGPYSEIVRFKTKPKVEKDCGYPTGVPQDKGKPYVGAYGGLIVNARGLDMELKEVVALNEPGWYKGVGICRVPYLGGSGYHAKFERIYINDNLEVILGRIDFVSKGIASMTAEQLAGERRIDRERRQRENRAQWSGTDFYEGVVFYRDTDIETIDPGATSTSPLVVTDKDGNETGNAEVIQLLNAYPTKALIIEDKNGDQWVVQKGTDGKPKVTKVEGGGLETGISESENEFHSNTVVDNNIHYSVTFDRVDNQQFGFDFKEHDPLAPYYQQEVIQDKNYWVAWKSVGKGRIDRVKAIASMQRPGFAKEVGFASDMGSLPKLPGNPTELSLTIQGRGHENVEEIKAYLTKSDSSGKKIEEVVGRLNVISYSPIYRTLVLVPVNGTKIEIEASLLEQQLNAIYGQAVVQWQVRTEPTIQVNYDIDNNGLEYGSSGYLSNYTSEMRTILSAYEQSNSIQTDTYYLFFVPKADKNSVSGYMPRKKQSGFIFAQEFNGSNQVKIIAHELGHGAFRLKHAFPELPENGKNLMDYGSTGTQLHKHQWDLIHNPTLVIDFFENDEDNSYAMQIAQCLGAAAIDMAMNYTFKWVELNFLDNNSENDYSIADFSKIWEATDKIEVFSSAAVSCGTAVIPWPTNKAKLIGVVTASFGAGATAMITDVGNQYTNLPNSLSFKQKLEKINWGQSFSKAGAQSLIAGISTGVVLYAVDHPKFRNFAGRLKNLTYEKVETILKKSEFSDEAVDAFCRRFGLSRLQRTGSLIDDALATVLKTHPNFSKLGLSKGELDDFKALLNTKMPNSASDIFEGLKSHLDAGTSFENMQPMISGLKNNWGNFSDGSKWVFNYTSSSKGLTQFGGKKIRFELPTETELGLRRIDIADVTNPSTPLLYEFKSVQTPFNSTYATQFIKDINAVDDLSQIKWLYDGSKVSSLNKVDYINLLKSNSGFNSTKVRSVFSKYAEDLGLAPITNQTQLESFLSSNNSWFTDVFKVVH